jgi:nitrate/TMAO reductase-like tetraheme cytochrome c subunit
MCLLVNLAAKAQISPGPLSKAHAHLEGMSNCTKCHSIGNAVTNKNCLACHKEIQSLITQKRGFHVSNAVKSKKCVDCHNDHHGRKFEMTRFDQKKFDHKEAGYVLQGAHATLECKDCHQPAKIENAQLKKRENTFLGLQQTCISCHKDVHQGTLDKNCASCHNVKKFKPATGFDHNKSKFKLQGAHTKQACVDCHKVTVKNGQEFQEFKGLKFSSCTSCHKDVHEGKFGANCLKCHTVESFKKPNITGSFNHNQTNYPLTGMHVKVDCKSCHKSGNYTTAINTNQCKNCHTDYHKGDFTKKGVSPDCKECHTLDQALVLPILELPNMNGLSLIWRAHILQRLVLPATKPKPSGNLSLRVRNVLIATRIFIKAPFPKNIMPIKIAGNVTIQSHGWV